MLHENGGNHHLHRRQIGLVVGNFTHDVIFYDSSLLSRTLGGAVSFISNVFSSSLSFNSFEFVSKVGSDFNYSVPFDPIISSSSKTTLFHAYFSSRNADRVLQRIACCDPILPSDLPPNSYKFGIAAAVAGEIPKETLARLFVQCETVLVDIQGLIRTFNEEDGTVKLKLLKSTEFYEMLDKVGFLKASSEEVEYMNVEEVRKKCCVIVTDGKDGCRVYWKDGCVKVPPFKAKQVDPTGAGDSFLGGFVVGLASGLNVADSALLGNFFGSITVGQVGVPKFEQCMMQKVKQELERKTVSSCCGNDVVDFLVSDIDEEFYSFLLEVAKLSRPLCSMSQDDEVPSPSHAFCPSILSDTQGLIHKECYLYMH